MEVWRIAIIGCGGIAEKHVASIAELDGEAELVGLCDLQQERVERFANDIVRPVFPAVAAYTSVSEVLEQENIDLVVIATSSDSHGRLAMAALKAGKHVIVEKPLALSLEEASAVTEEARERKLVAAVCFQARYLPLMEEMKSAERMGKFGKLSHGVVSMRWKRELGYYRSSPWRESRGHGGGVFMNQCIHYIDLLLWLMGPVQSVYAQAGTYGDPIGVENAGAVVLRFRSGAIGLIEASTIIAPRTLGTSISLFGEKGSAVIEGANLDQRKVWSFYEDEAPAEDKVIANHGISHTPLYREILESIREQKQPSVSAEQTMHALEVVLAIYSSLTAGEVVQLPMGTDSGQSVRQDQESSL
ncbi:Gfo/Idh/MocA family protein [Paenibacillus sp. 1011MAR3C5]|uniref:Gfo/Idh/MocA family protein n=1 Tax=Paenibacillus sp. 1011MAR3C5 TaxID=1675787 RepID=UPI001600C00A|nr:Gfo/Idh/MocA family oxidoreductase [Paenibacillus sp. 1011MAR3C5]